MTDWSYKGAPVVDDVIPAGSIGFIYKITRISDGRMYIGKKLLKFSSTSMKTVALKNGTKKKKKVKTLRDSDWKTYWSSSVELVEDVKLLGEESFTREILAFCQNLGSLSYYEARWQMDLRVLERADSYNGIVSCRCHHSHVKPIL